MNFEHATTWNIEWLVDVRWTAAPQPALADRHMWGAQEQGVGEALKWQRLNQCEYSWVHKTQMDGTDWTCILAHVLHSKSCSDQHDHILELRIPRKILAQDVPRRLKAFGICHAFWEPNQNVDQRWLRFEGLLLDPDWLVAATVLSRRLCLFGRLTLGISQCSPEALPDPIL